MYVKKKRSEKFKSPLVRHNSTSNGGMVGSRLMDKPDHQVGKKFEELLPIEEEKDVEESKKKSPARNLGDILKDNPEEEFEFEDLSGPAYYSKSKSQVWVSFQARPSKNDSNESGVKHSLTSGQKNSLPSIEEDIDSMIDK